MAPNLRIFLEKNTWYIVGFSHHYLGGTRPHRCGRGQRISWVSGYERSLCKLFLLSRSWSTNMCIPIFTSAGLSSASFSTELTSGSKPAAVSFNDILASRQHTNNCVDRRLCLVSRCFSVNKEVRTLRGYSSIWDNPGWDRIPSKGLISGLCLSVALDASTAAFVGSCSTTCSKPFPAARFWASISSDAGRPTTSFPGCLVDIIFQRCRSL